MKPKTHSLILAIFFFFFFLQFHSSSSSATTSKSLQLVSLISLKSSLKDPLLVLSDWDPTSVVVNSTFNSKPPLWCTWSGIQCHDKTSDIVSLDLSGANISGVIPSQIKFLTHLRNLNLSRNSFDGTLSDSIFDLPQLESLDISHNDFSGSFPPGLSKLKSLTVLNAYSNSFTGPLPLFEVITSLLRHLNLGGSFFDGEIPKSYGSSSLQGLNFLQLSGNSLQGEIPAELGSLSQLEHLEIGYNVFTGSIPLELVVGCTNLKYLDISAANISGNLPSGIGNLSALESLFLFKNQISGEIPDSFSNLVNLKSLDLSDNQFSGEIPPGFSSLNELTLLSLLGNNLTGEIPQGIGQLPNLETLLLWNNSLSGNLPRNLGSNFKLKLLDVSSNSLTGSIPPSLCSGNQLVKLILFSNRFDSEIPSSLTKCTSLWRFRIEDNLLNGSIPEGFGLLPNLTYMDLSMNSFSGKIPNDLGEATKLQFLNISRNSFGNELPKNIWKAPSLQIFSASFSNLIGTIPDFIGGCKSLYKLDLEGNSLNGSIPWDIGDCKKLLALNLKQNSLSGIIPWELSKIPSITDVDLSHNSLNGSIPLDFESSRTLEFFNVSYNNLTGSIPSSGTAFPSLHPSSFAHNENLCGDILNKPCFSGNLNQNPEADQYGQDDKKSSSSIAIVWIMAVAFGIGIFILIAGSRFFHSRRFYASDHDQQNQIKSGPWKLTAFQRLNYTVDDVLECLSTSDTVIGMGSTGTVYKAEMPGGEIIAVKKLWGKQHKETVRRRRGVLAEVEVLGNVRHRNIVRLLGCCSNTESTLLLYEYMPNGSLDDLLHGPNKKLLGHTSVKDGAQQNDNFVNGVGDDWVVRYKIALGIAQGICYLHHDCDPVIVHRDVKPCNILLDSDLEARVADFGVAKLIQTDESMSVIAGSCGYIAPEYAYTLQVDEKSDIYSYGVVLMEILSGKKSVEPEFGEGNSIVDWVRSKVKTKEGVTEVLDKNAGSLCESVREEMMLVLRVALHCTSSNPAERPSMRDVVSILHEAKPQRKIPGSLNSGGPAGNTAPGVDGGGDGVTVGQKLGI
ncbi:hypothetical protein MKW94_014738 [Papaver nudicaule]|uniref:non-specific serine/threonine protein kinase n=1 Tax=Papaver nudicaule TaxID=74823 RepID=A0AA41V8C7_PAPNU|nr:hypothetical protein [Papaver nudicaule]